jgi:hypothetical protein
MGVEVVYISVPTSYCTRGGGEDQIEESGVPYISDGNCCRWLLIPIDGLGRLDLEVRCRL